MAGASPKLAFIRLDQIRINPVSLRGANKTELSFEELRRSIAADGVLNAVSVREKPGEDGKKYELVDGLQRFTASSDIGTGVVVKQEDPNKTGSFISIGQYEDDGKGGKIGTIPAQVIERTEADTIIAQIIGNAHRIETKPVEYAKAINKYLGYSPTLTIAGLAAILNKNPGWLDRQLGLLNLHEELKPLVDDQKIPAINAYSLAKMPADEQLNWKDRAQTMPASEFIPAATARIKEIRDAHKKGKDAAPEQFIPVAHLRKIGELKQEMDTPEIGPALVRDGDLTKGIKPNADGLVIAANAGFLLGLKWALNLDPSSVKLQQEKDAARRKKEGEDKTRRDAERSKKKADELQKKTEEALAEAKKAAEEAAKLPPAPAVVA